MMKQYGTPATEADIQRAQFLNYLKAPKPLQQAMQGTGAMSRYSMGVNTDAANQDAFNDLAWAQKQAEYDLARRPGVVQIGTDGQRQQFAAPAFTPAQLVEQTANNLPPALSGFLSPQGEQQRQAARQQRPGGAAAHDSPDYRGMAGVGSGSVNGVETLYPKAGRTAEFGQSMAAAGVRPSSVGDVSRAGYEQGRYGVVKGQERTRVAQRKAAEAAGDLAFERQKELAGLKGGPGGRRSGDTVDEAGQKAGQRGFYKDRSDWREIQAEGSQLMSLVKSAEAQGLADVPVDMEGNTMPLEELRIIASSKLSVPEPRWEDYGFASKGSATATGSARAGARASASKGGPATRPSPAPAEAPPVPGFDRLTGSALDQAIAIASEDARNPATKAEAQRELAYLKKRKAAGY